VTRARILVADDDPVAARFVASLLTDHGFDVLVAQDGQHALDLALEHRLDLIVSDLVMPYRDGFELLRMVRSEPGLASLPVVIVSMKDREEDIVRGLELGADDYVVKPFNARELVARVRKILGRGAEKRRW
jgi:DNA-binding response OmpR family regulator